MWPSVYLNVYTKSNSNFNKNVRIYINLSDMLFFSSGVQRFWLDLDTVRMFFKKSKRNAGCTVDYLKEGWREIIDNV